MFSQIIHRIFPILYNQQQAHQGYYTQENYPRISTCICVHHVECPVTLVMGYSLTTIRLKAFNFYDTWCLYELCIFALLLAVNLREVCHVGISGHSQCETWTEHLQDGFHCPRKCSEMLYCLLHNPETKVRNSDDCRNQIWLRGLSLPNLAQVIQTGHLMHEVLISVKDDYLNSQ